MDQSKRQAEAQKEIVDRQAVAALVVHANLTESQAKAAVTAIAKCQIPSVLISY